MQRGEWQLVHLRPGNRLRRPPRTGHLTPHRPQLHSKKTPPHQSQQPPQHYHYQPQCASHPHTQAISCETVFCLGAGMTSTLGPMEVVQGEQLARVGVLLLQVELVAVPLVAPTLRHPNPGDGPKLTDALPRRTKNTAMNQSITDRARAAERKTTP